MKNKTTLLFGIHMHQPVDNFKEVITNAVNVCYMPFFEVAKKYPEFRFSLHCSGWLMQCIEKDHPKLFGIIKELSQKGSLEFFSAGYYEPILSSIPSHDRVAQVNKLSHDIKKKFDQKPKGLWLTERVWDASLIPDLCESEIEFCVVDDYHFQSVGFDEGELDGYYMTEENAKSIGVFPISKKLRYALPFTEVKNALDSIKSFNRQKDSAAVIFDDAEKFGMWPGTYSWVYEKGWLEKFIKAVLEDDEIVCGHFSSYAKENKPRGIAYLPNVSYFEMGEWSLKADDALRLESYKKEIGEERYNKEGVKFLKGSVWKNFFVKYDESNRLHKRMLELSRLRGEMDESSFYDNLYRLQTNDVFWHGVFGGLYLPNLRDNAYRYLIECERARYGDECLISSENTHMDGYEKIKAVTSSHILMFDTKAGAQLIEFDCKEASFNWQNTLTRRKEAYHEEMLNSFSSTDKKSSENMEGIDTIHNISHKIDEEIKDALVYDWYVKNSFIDHITDKSITLESFRNCSFKEYGDFVNQPFVCEDKSSEIAFFREGGVYIPQKYPALLKKRYTPKDNGFEFGVDFQTESDYFFNYALELNLHFAEYDKVLVDGETISFGGKKERVRNLSIKDGYLKKEIIINLDKEVDVLFYPLRTLSQSEQGYDMTTQALSIALILTFSKNFKLEGTLEVKDV